MPCLAPEGLRLLIVGVSPLFTCWIRGYGKWGDTRVEMSSCVVERGKSVRMLHQNLGLGPNQAGVHDTVQSPPKNSIIQFYTTLNLGSSN